MKSSIRLAMGECPQPPNHTASSTFFKMIDNCVSIHPYFAIKPGCSDKFREVCKKFVSKTSSEQGCLYYGFSFADHQAFCREGYVNADAALIHLDNVGAEIQEALQYAEIERLEIHGNADQLEILKEKVASLNPVLFTLEQGFRH